uniref:Uncharacterized protein n=1 Tax=Panagrolaimus superbus TaxID=310955 RepID=A0A914XTT7_9BILA
MVRKFIALVSIILIFFCTTSFVNGQGSDLDDVENSLEILTTRIAKLFQNLVLNLEKWLAKLDKHIIGLSGIVIFSCIIFIIGIILLCILAPCVYSVTSCIESCTHCCTGNKETRANEKK